MNAHIQFVPSTMLSTTSANHGMSPSVFMCPAIITRTANHMNVFHAERSFTMSSQVSVRVARNIPSPIKATVVLPNQILGPKIHNVKRVAKVPSIIRSPKRIGPISANMDRASFGASGVSFISK